MVGSQGLACLHGGGWLEEKSCNDLVDSFKLELVPKGKERF